MGAYIRVANKETTPEDSAIKLQKEIINKYVKEQLSNNYSIEYYIDNGYSGTTFNRPEFKRMLHDIKEGKIKGIIIKDLSRFARANDSLLKIQELQQKYQINLISITENIDTINNPAKLKFMSDMVSIMRKQASERIKMGKKFARENR